jgi:uncharacterized protein YdaU (DUF1376 family)
LFDPKRFADDTVVQSFSTLTAAGAYVFLLCAAWDQAEPGVLPASDRILAGLARATTAEWELVREDVARAFDTVSRPGFWVQKGLVRTYQAQSEFIEKKRSAGVARAGLAGRDGGRFTSTTTSTPPAHHQHTHQHTTSTPTSTQPAHLPAHHQHTYQHPTSTPTSTSPAHHQRF